MSGWLTDGVPQVSLLTGAEQFPLDTQLASGANPQSGMSTTFQLAQLIEYCRNNTSKTMVAGSRYYVAVTLGFPALLTGVEVKVGGTGGTDLWLVELHDSTGALVATSALAGVTAGTANIFQRIAFTATYTAAPGNYFIAVQSNGTTATLATLQAPSLPINTGSATGSFGTSAAITPPTTYTQGVGPLAQLY